MFTFSSIFCQKKESLAAPGIEPGPPGLQATVLTIAPRRILMWSPKTWVFQISTFFKTGPSKQTGGRLRDFGVECSELVHIEIGIILEIT